MLKPFSNPKEGVMARKYCTINRMSYAYSLIFNTPSKTRAMHLIWEKSDIHIKARGKNSRFVFMWPEMLQI